MSAYVAVIGAAEVDDAQRFVAEEVGAGLAAAGYVVVTGGLGGVMEAASRGAKSHRGLTVGVLPGDSRDAANGWVDVAIATGLGELRNGLLVRTVDAVVAIGGGAGTLSEIGFALKLGRPVVGLDSWDVAGVEVATGPADAVARIAAQIRRTLDTN
jgi:uncharacterized protein (TIGR00725 family)